MPRMILRTMATIMAVCIVCLSPTQMYSKNPENGILSKNTSSEVDEYVSLTCPMPITISCDDNGIYQTFEEFEAAGGSVILPDGCEEENIQISWQGDNILAQSGCSFTIFREYLLTADCNNTFTCNQIVMQTDDDNPFIAECASDTTLIMDNSGGTCLVSYTVPSVIAVDGCDPDVTVSNDAPSTFGIGNTLVTYTATDNCGNSTQCTMTVSVVDNSPLTVNCPPNISLSNVCDISEVPPYVDYAAFVVAGGSVSGNCSSSSSSFTIQNVTTTLELSSCPSIYERMYTISDGVNNGICIQTITISDDITPSFTLPADITVNCGSAQDTSVTGAPTNILDNCTSLPSVTWSDMDSTQLSTACNSEITFTRSWIVTDACMNSDTMDQTITTIDTVAPIAICKDTLVLYLDANGDAIFVADSLDNGSTDNCNSPLSFTAFPSMTFVSCNQIAGEIPISLIVSDGCGNSSSCDLMINLLDTMSITLTSPPNDTVMNIEDVPLPFIDYDEYFLAGGNVNDNCLVNNSLNLLSADTIAICQLEIVRTYEYVDFSGNNDTATHTIIVTNSDDLADNEPPVISNVGPQFVILKHADCTFDTTFTLPTATDDYNIDTTYFTISEFVNDTAQVTFIAEDLCGNQTDTIFDLVLLDPTSPDILIDDITIMCDSVGAAPIYTSIEEFLTGPNAMVYDCRLDSLSFIHMGDVILPDGSINRTYSIDDLTGNTGTEIQNITIADMTEPEFTFCPASILINTTDADTCVQFVDIPTPEFMDNCMGTLTLSHNSPFGVDSSNADGYYPIGTTEVSYFLADENGLMDTCTFNVSVVDTIVPEISCPMVMSVDCDFSNYTMATDSASFVGLGGTLSDACGINTLTSAFAAVENTTDQFIVTYTVFDNNGNSNTCSHTIAVVDTEDPVLSCVTSIIVPTPANSCDTLLTIAAPTATDNCGVIDTIYNNLTMTDDATMVYSGTTTITWYAIDAAGNIDSCMYDIIVADGTSPITVDPRDSIVMCDEMAEAVDTFQNLADLVAAGGSATDNCGVEFFEIDTEIEIGEDTIQRIYIATDSSGNSSTLVHNIIIDDTTAPTFNAPADIVIDCSISLDSLELLGTVDISSIDDNCGEIDTLIFSDNILSSGGCLANDIIQRIWILTDISGNESRDTQIITKIDTVGPTFDMSLMPIADILCGDDLPTTQKLTATDNCNGAIVTIDTIPGGPIMASCSDRPITYMYTATDNCGNITKDSVTFIKLGDITGPILITDNSVVLNTTPGLCGVPVDSVPEPEFSDDCSGISLNSNYFGDTYNLDTTRVIWTATNTCGQTSQTTQVIVVNDNEPPVVVCQDLNVSLGGDGFAIVQADTLAKSITDNCAHYFVNKTTARRLDDGSVCGNSGALNSSVTFCCEDIGKTIMVEVQVHDGNGNINTCHAAITINNAQLQPNIPVLPDITISCEYLYNSDDLSIFGSYVDDPADQEDIIIEDHFYTAWDSIAGEDVVYLNTCGMTTVTESSDFVTGGCGNDTLTRYFKFNNGLDSFTLKQRIIRQDINPFTESDIEWPAYFSWNQCMNPAPDTSISGSPILSNNDYCSQVAVTYKDQIFNTPTTSCPFVKRKWEIIDWCQYDNSNGEANNPGLWTYSQFITVENNVPPTILSACNDTLICAPGNSCDATVSLSILAEDDCNVSSENLLYSYNIDIGNDNNSNNDISGTTSSFTHPVISGIHKVTWSVNDRCGNTSHCEYLITVQECKDPTPVCLDGLALDLSGQQSVELWATDLNQSSSDNCTPMNQLLISFSSDTSNNLKTFTCDDLGPNEVDMWVTDLAGNQSFCTGTVTIQDNQGVCSNTPSVIIEGLIKTENNVAIPEAMVSILGAEMDQEFMTDNDGQYAFQDLDVLNNYQIQVDRNKDYLDGVTTLDLVKIQRHILGLENLDSPYKLIAADVNNSESVTASDLLTLRKLILGVDTELNENTSWRFVSKNENMDDMNSPWPFTEELTLHMDDSQSIDSDFIGVKIGDVNNSAESLLTYEELEKRNDNALQILMEDKIIRRDDEIYIELINDTEIDLEAVQMTITWDADVMSLLDIVPIGIDLRDYHTSVISDHQMTIAWHNVEGKKISAGVPLFQLVMEGNKKARLSNVININSDITEAIAYNHDDESMDVSLRFISNGAEGIVFNQNKPNPFLSETSVEFSLPESMEVTFKVFAGSGKLIHKTTKNYNEGSNILKLGEQLKGYKGVLFLKMEAAEFSDVKRMIRIE